MQRELESLKSECSLLDESASLLTSQVQRVNELVNGNCLEAVSNSRFGVASESKETCVGTEGTTDFDSSKGNSSVQYADKAFTQYAADMQYLRKVSSKITTQLKRKLKGLQETVQQYQENV